VLVVGFDTATPVVSVALHDGERVVAEASAADGRRHGELLAPMIAQVLADAGASRADLTAVAVGVGPGPYTGLRVGVVTARVLGAVLGIPVRGVCSLDVIAAAVPRGREFLVATDARRKEVYWARYAAEPGDGARRATRLTGPAVDYPATVAEQLDGAPVVGRGAVLYPDLLGAHTGPLDVSAGHLAAVALRALDEGSVLPVEPLYLRRPDAAPSHPRKPVTQAAPHGRA
jgi:tRNA threonylcarbamoyl adenosine modification protein YeaZ